MEEKLRKKFVKTAMIAVFVSLSLIFIAIIVSSFIELNKRADQLLDMIIENGGNITAMRNKRIDAYNHAPPQKKSKIFIEDPFAARIFMVKTDKEKNIISVDTSEIFAVLPVDAVVYGETVLKRGKKTGFLKNYKYRFTENTNGGLIVFVDSEREINVFYSTLINTAFILAAADLLIFIAVNLLSKKAVAPIIKAYEKQKRFITDASHELKTPLAIIKTNVDVIEIKYGADKWTENIKNQTDRLNILVENMILLTKIDEEKLNLIEKRFNISELLEEIIADFSQTVNFSGKKFECNIEQDLDYVSDEALIKKLITIFIDNAVKYSDEKSSIEIFLNKKQKIEFVIKNKCRDLKAGDYSALFERFIRLDSHRNSKTGGHGIGLSIAKLICEKTGAIIRAYSDEDGVFIIQVNF